MLNIQHLFLKLRIQYYLYFVCVFGDGGDGFVLFVGILRSGNDL